MSMGQTQWYMRIESRKCDVMFFNPGELIQESLKILIIVMISFLIVSQGLCSRKRFYWRLTALGHTILVTKATGAFVQVGEGVV